ncbi:MAG: Crp/Fnr family transcriptional regulator [Gammaproteobacteria bacterium]|nr:Crp/Fnr family transcriptional regulator [Gammaproteobacteria bacterium]
MLNDNQLEQVKTAFPLFSQDHQLLAELQAQCQMVTLAADTVICEDGQVSTDLPLLITGLIRVYKISELGKEITLYHIGENESCILSASTILGSKSFPAIAQTVTECKIVVLPEKFVAKLLVQSTPWQHFIFGLVAQRLTDVITVVEEVAFQRMDKRIAKYLSKKLNTDFGTIKITHQEIADQIGTAREVVTRILRDLELRQILVLARGQIKVSDINQLIQISQQ